MKARLTMRAALALGLASVARNIGRARRVGRAMLAHAGQEARKGNLLPAALLIGLFIVGL